MGKLFNSLTFSLFVRPSFIEGLARIMDFGSGLQIYNYSKDGKDADFKALQNDWRQIGRDIELSISRYEQEK